MFACFAASSTAGNEQIMKRYHNSTIINSDFMRGGINLENEKTSEGTTSRLLLTRASLRDNGNYTCVAASQSSESLTPSLTALPDSVVVQVVNR
jgi:hypothetical protein